MLILSSGIFHELSTEVSMDGIDKFIEEFDSRWTDFGAVDFYMSRYDQVDCTEEIENSLRAIRNTFRYCKIPVEEDSSKTDVKCIKTFKVLMLSTDFKCLSEVIRIPKNGIFFPKMTPYCLLEIVAWLEYEQIMAELLLGMPLDLSIEVLEIVRSNIFIWEFERGLDLVVSIILNCYKNLLFVCTFGTQSKPNDLETNLASLIIYTQEFMAFLSLPKFLRLFEVENLQKSERMGTIVKKIISLSLKCLSCIDKDSIPDEIAKHYWFRFFPYPVQISTANYDPQMHVLNQEFMAICLKTLQEVDIECYQNWADLQADRNPSVSLQSSIRTDLYHFREFLELYKCFMYNKDLMTILEKFDPQPVPIVSSLNVDGLRYGTVEKKIESIKSIIYRYEEWDHITFDVLQRNRHFFDSDDIPYLFDYLELIMKKPAQEYHKARVFVTIRRTLFRERVSDDWAIEIDYPKKENNDPRIAEYNEFYERVKTDILECLDSLYSEENFKNFIATIEDLKSPKNLRKTLQFLLYNPRNALRIIIKVVIGVPDYAHLSVTLEDVIFFYPMIRLGGSHMRLILIELRTVIIHCDKWDALKFTDLVNLMLNKYKFTANDFVTHVFTHWIEDQPTDLSDFVLILQFMHDSVINRCEAPLSILRIAESFARILTVIRRDRKLPRTVSTEIISEICRTVTPLFESFGYDIQDDIPMHQLEPIDRFQTPFLLLSTGLLYSDRLGASTVTNLKYECMRGIKRAQTRGNGSIPLNPDAPVHSRDLQHLQDDFVRYIMINCSETEMVQFAEGLAEFEFMNPNVYSKMRVIDKITRHCIETAIYFLEFPHLNPPEAFACLMRGFARFLGTIVTRILQYFNSWHNVDQYRQNIYELRLLYDCYTTVKENIRVLAETVRHSTFHLPYESLMALVDDPSLHNEPRGIALCKIRIALEKFGNECLEIPQSEVRFDGTTSARALRFKRSHDFISECLEVDDSITNDPSQYHWLCASLKMLRDQDCINDQDRWIVL